MYSHKHTHTYTYTGMHSKTRCNLSNAYSGVRFKVFNWDAQLEHVFTFLFWMCVSIHICLQVTLPQWKYTWVSCSINHPCPHFSCLKEKCWLIKGVCFVFIAKYLLVAFGMLPVRSFEWGHAAFKAPLTLCWLHAVPSIVGSWARSRPLVILASQLASPQSCHGAVTVIHRGQSNPSC